ncbi:MAG: hypothetical protein JWR61_2886 [Ferruginibacter sp.]|uniref:hypothetical protein n=1 Tax=Ferruginibacter sp. TaxID=1940288 RepID=UPI002657D2B6|nr:hypothetical protein [Ferruginibacter sp.]MDB5277931.1 hypothetical protein [Ferruginibacter sp.]
MKKLLVMGLIVLCVEEASAQTWDEWFRQKATQKKYLLQQIAALKIYAGYLSQGYAIAKNGLGIIQNIKQGDYGLHSNYFSSLSTVNPRVKQYVKIVDMIFMEASFVEQTAKAIKSFNNSSMFNHTELDFIRNVFQNVLKGGAANLDDLHNILTNGQLKLKDDERITAIDKLYDDMLDKKTFLTQFCNSTSILMAQRVRTADEIAIDKKLNGLP